MEVKRKLFESNILMFAVRHGMFHTKAAQCKNHDTYCIMTKVSWYVSIPEVVVL